MSALTAAASLNNLSKGSNSLMGGNLLGLPSITGGAAAPSSAFSQGSTASVSMSNAFSVAGAGGKANSTAEASGGIDITTIVVLMAAAALFLAVIK